MSRNSRSAPPKPWPSKAGADDVEGSDFRVRENALMTVGDSPMFGWLNPKAFLIAAFITAVGLILKMPESGVTTEWIVTTAIAVVIGGVFWGAIGTAIYNSFKKR